MSDFLTSDNLFGFVTGTYIIAGLLFIAALAGLSRHETAKLGNLAGMAGMGLALLATLLLAAQKAELLDERSFAVTLLLVLLMMGAGAAVGAWRARTVEMTGMPELVAMLHSFVGLAAVLVGINSYLEYEGFADAAPRRRGVHRRLHRRRDLHRLDRGVGQAQRADVVLPADPAAAPPAQPRGHRRLGRC